MGTHCLFCRSFATRMDLSCFFSIFLHKYGLSSSLCRQSYFNSHRTWLSHSRWSTFLAFGFLYSWNMSQVMKPWDIALTAIKILLRYNFHGTNHWEVVQYQVWCFQNCTQWSCGSRTFDSYKCVSASTTTSSNPRSSWSGINSRSHSSSRWPCSKDHHDSWQWSTKSM